MHISTATRSPLCTFQQQLGNPMHISTATWSPLCTFQQQLGHPYAHFKNKYTVDYCLYFGMYEDYIFHANVLNFITFGTWIIRSLVIMSYWSGYQCVSKLLCKSNALTLACFHSLNYLISNMTIVCLTKKTNKISLEYACGIYDALYNRRTS